MIRLALLLAVAAVLGAADDQIWPLAENRTDTIYFVDGDPMFGTLLEEDGKRFLVNDKGGKFELRAGTVDHIEPKRLAAQIVAHNAPLQVQRKDPAGLIRTLDFGLEKNAQDAVLAALREALKALPGDTDLAQFAFKHLQDPAEIEAVARATLKKSDLFEPGYEALSRVLLDGNRLDELDQVVKTWLEKRPTSETANRLMAAAAEKRGDIRTAAECYRKGKDLHKNPDAAIGYARCALKLGEHANAQKAAADLLAAGKHQDEAAAIAGAAQLALGKPDDAVALLTQALAGTPSDEMAVIARYDLGLAKWKTGDVAGAREAWSQASTPESALALAILERKPFRDLGALTHPRLKAIAQEHNACLDLERKDPAKATAALDPKANKRHAFLRDIADTLARNGDESTVRALAATPGTESLRWQAYAHLLASRWRDADAVLAKLPADDGWAQAYRIYSAAAQRDDGRARELYRGLAVTKDPPRDYAARLAAEYEVADDARDIEEFDWKDNEVLGSGWQSAAIGTGIKIHAVEGRLVLEGKQTPSQDPVSRAWRLAPTARMRGVQAEFDLSAASSATAGLELTDDQRTAGVELAVTPEKWLGWRPLGGATWEKLPLQIAGAQVTLRLEYQNGRIFAVQPEDPTKRYALGGSPFKTAPETVCVGVFAVADPGVAWRLAVESLELQLKPAAAVPR